MNDKGAGSVKKTKISFLNLSRDESSIVHLKILDNGQTLLDTAQAIALQSKFGLALSISVLGAEEYLKGMVLYFYGVGINVFSIKELRGVLSNHKNRHEMACLLELLRIIESFITIDSIKEEKQAKGNFLESMINFADKASIVLKSIVSMADNINWWEKADDYKKRGIYVDYNGELLLPSSITQSEYEIGSNIVNDLIKSCRVIKAAFERMDQKTLNETIANINSGIEIMEKRLKTLNAKNSNQK